MSEEAKNLQSENSARRTKFIIIVGTALVSTVSFLGGRQTAPAPTGLATVEHVIKLSGQIDCNVKGPIPVKLDQTLRVIELKK